LFVLEILNFFEKGGSTLLIKGEPGAGKTTLALTIAKSLNPKTLVYMSTRLSEEHLFVQYPWLKTIGIEVKDFRIGTAGVFIESYVESLKKQGCVIVLDSWDAFSTLLDAQDRIKTESAMISLASTPVSGSKVIFVSERNEVSPLDYMVDGVIVVTSEELDGRTIRRVDLKKLRGVSVDHRVRVLTLEGGVAKLFGTYKEPDYSIAKYTEPVPDKEALFSLGSESLDKAFGGLKKGSVFTVEYTPKVPYSAVRMLAVPAQVNFLNLGRSVFVVPLVGSEYHEFAQHLKRMVKTQAYTQNLKVFEGESPSKESLSDVFLRVREDIEQLRKRSSNALVMRVVSVNRLEGVAEKNELIAYITREIEVAQAKGDPMVFYLPSDSAFCSLIRSVSSLHVRLDVVDGTVVARGEKPYTPFYVVESDVNNPFFPVLTPIL
jgi:RecA-superfamily ATPases implicated in signal transduction